MSCKGVGCFHAGKGVELLTITFTAHDVTAEILEEMLHVKIVFFVSGMFFVAVVRFSEIFLI